MNVPHAVARWKTWCQQYVYREVRRGKMIRAEHCIECGGGGTEGHRPDYLKPHFVLWICKSCHRRLHWMTERMGIETGCADVGSIDSIVQHVEALDRMRVNFPEYCRRARLIPPREERKGVS